VFVGKRKLHRYVKQRTDREPCLGNVHTDTVYFFVGVFVMPDENEVKQVQEPAQEQQQQSAEQKPPEPPPPELQVAETQASETAEAPSENPNP
jgi:FtsZ-interacting cell division protein YlmF